MRDVFVMGNSAGGGACGDGYAVSVVGGEPRFGGGNSGQGRGVVILAAPLHYRLVMEPSSMLDQPLFSCMCSVILTVL